MFQSGIFDYVNVLDKAADAAWKRNDAIANNIANATTPGYKRQDVSFEDEMKKAMSGSKYSSLSSKVSKLSNSNLEAKVYTDSSGYSYRLDGNNVDVETENVTLVKNQLKYNALMDSINGEFSSLQMVMK